MLTPEETVMLQEVSKLLSKKTAEQGSSTKFRQGTVVHVPTRNWVENVSANFGYHYFLHNQISHETYKMTRNKAD